MLTIKIRIASLQSYDLFIWLIVGETKLFLNLIALHSHARNLLKESKRRYAKGAKQTSYQL